MSQIQDLIEAYVAKMKAIPALVTAAGGDANNIAAHHQKNPTEGDILQLIAEMAPSEALVYLGNSGNVNRTSRELFGYEIRIAFRPADEPNWFDFYEAFCNGVPTGTTTRLRYQQATNRFYPMNPPSFRRQSIAVAENTIFTYLEIAFTVAQRGDV